VTALQALGLAPSSSAALGDKWRTSTRRRLTHPPYATREHLQPRTGIASEHDRLLELLSEVIALRRIGFFRYLTDGDLSRLARIGRHRSFAPGEGMVGKGSDRGGFFVILSGAAEVETGGAVHVLGPIDFFGEMALLAGSPRTATVRAVQPVQTMVFEAMAFRPFLIENPSVAVTLLERGAADRINEAQARLEADRAWR
jgi:CRP-like cAMP-binding protein